MFQDDRTAQVLRLVIREYVRTAIPVASNTIVRDLSEDVSSATVRNIFNNLADAGYLDQPHTSAGRIPTQRAYRFFVDELFSGDRWNVRATPLVYNEARELKQHLTRAFRLMTGVCAGDDAFSPMGLDDVFSFPEFRDQALVVEFARFLEDIPRRARAYRKMGEQCAVAVFIGDENPITSARHMGVIALPVADDGVFIVAGPMRMDYERIIRYLATA